MVSTTHRSTRAGQAASSASDSSVQASARPEGPPWLTCCATLLRSCAACCGGGRGPHRQRDGGAGAGAGDGAWVAGLWVGGGTVNGGWGRGLVGVKRAKSSGGRDSLAFGVHCLAGFINGRGLEECQ